MNKFTIFWSLGIVALVLLINGCGGTGGLSKADDAKKRMQYKVAGDLYTLYGPKAKGPNAKEEQRRAREEAAYCYRMANDYEKAIKAYEKVLKKDEKNTEALYQLASLKMKVAGGNDCDPEAMREAREYIKKYLEEVPNDERGLKKLEAMDSAENWRKDAPNSRFKVTNFKIANTKGMDYSPMIASKKDDVVYFSSDREGPVSKKKIYGYTGNGFSDMWYVKGKASKGNKKTAATKTWEKPVIALGTINTKFNDGSCVFDRKYSTIYYTQCNGADGKSTSCKLFQAKLEGTQWASEQMLSFCINDTLDYGHPALSDDGKTLYFSSNRDGGEGGYDIWCAVYNQRAKDWGNPFNLGPTINTDKDEMFPYWNSHDNSLYFSSNGHLGMGALDIFKVEGAGTEWTAPENLRAPLNSGGDDFGVTFDNNNPDHGFFTSNRCGGKGNFDIYEFNISPCVIQIEGYVYECLPGTMSDARNIDVSKPLKNSTITITNDKDSVKVVVKTDDKGYYGPIRLKEKTTYEISCENRELYYFDAPPVQRTTKGVRCGTNMKQDFCLRSQIIIQTVPIFYDLDKANIRPDAAQVLNDSILPLLVKYPKLRMELGSHTDCRSSYEYNIDLSQRRADSAVAYLVRKGVDARRLIAKGYGESQLVNHCECEGAKKVNCSEAEHQRNRRTTIKTLDVNFDPKVMVDEGPNKDNINVKTTIVKLTKKDANYVVLASGNGNENPMPSLVTAGADITISMAELKMLKTKGLIKPTDLTGMTFADIDAGRLKPGATVKLATLRFGPKDRSYTFNDVTLKIGSAPNPYIFGIDALKTLNGTLNAEEGEMTFKHINQAALKGGPVDANATKGNTPANEANGAPKATDTLSLEDHQRINLVSENGNLYVPTMVNDKENVNWVYDAKARKIEINEDMVKQLLDNGAITKKDFDTEGESIRLKDGTKLPSNTFVIAKLQIGDVTMENVKVVINSKIEEPVLGAANTAVKKLNIVVKGKTMYMKPKEKKTRPGKDDE
jgi:outer membrane protein OmpA-like peptidoglycan-associated protein